MSDEGVWSGSLCQCWYRLPDMFFDLDFLPIRSRIAFKIKNKNIVGLLLTQQRTSQQ